MALEPPTTHLIPILQLSKHPNAVELPQLLRTSLQYLRTLYCPPVRGSRKIQTRSRSSLFPPSTAATAIADALEALRADAFERAYAIRWLTALVARIAMIIPEDGMGIVEEAAALLAACAGTSAAGVIEREFEFPLLDWPSTVRVTIRDTPLENGDYGSVGKQTWGGACVLAEMIAEDPGRILGAPLQDIGVGSTGPYRVLELGSGTGLVGLTMWVTLRALFKKSPGGQRAEVVLTDFHDAVLDNLGYNMAANAGSIPQDTSPESSCVKLTKHNLDWSLFAQLPLSDGPLSSDGFDLVVGADIIYEAEHALWIRECLNRLLKPKAQFHLVIPHRRTHTAECETVEKVFGAGDGEGLVVLERETIRCSGSSADDDVEYSHFRIGRR